MANFPRQFGQPQQLPRFNQPQHKQEEEEYSPEGLLAIGAAATLAIVGLGVGLYNYRSILDTLTGYIGSTSVAVDVCNSAESIAVQVAKNETIKKTTDSIKDVLASKDCTASDGSLAKCVESVKALFK